MSEDAQMPVPMPIPAPPPAVGDAGGYWPGVWPGEDGGPARLARPRLPVPPPPAALADPPEVVTRMVAGATMVVLRDPGEVFVAGHGIPESRGGWTTGWVERVDPVSLEPLARCDLPGGPLWPGGCSVHADGTLHVTFGRWCHRLDADCSVLAARELPRDRPYNSHLVLPDGHLVTKTFVPDGSEVSQLAVLDPTTLEVVTELALPEASIARLSAVGDTVVVVGDHSVFRLDWDAGRARMVLDESWGVRYRTEEGQTFGWDPVLAGDSVWFLDDGAGSEGYVGTLRGVGVSTAPLRLWRVPVDPTVPATSVVVSGLPGGIVANPPLVDPERAIALGYDTGNGVLAAWRFGEAGDPEGFELLWRHDQDHGGHLIGWPTAGRVATFDHVAPAGDHLVVRDLETGEECWRVPTGSPVQSVLFPAPDPAGGCYTTTFLAVSRISWGSGEEPG